LTKGDQQQQQEATFDRGHLPLGPPEGHGGERIGVRWEFSLPSFLPNPDQIQNQDVSFFLLRLSFAWKRLRKRVLLLQSFPVDAFSQWLTYLLLPELLPELLIII
jgi:hypothetical protein